MAGGGLDATVNYAAAALSHLSARMAASVAAGGSFLLGALPSSADAALLAQLAYILHAPPLAGSALRERLLARENRALVAYANALLSAGCSGGSNEPLFGSVPLGVSGAVHPESPLPSRLASRLGSGGTLPPSNASAAASGGTPQFLSQMIAPALTSGFCAHSMGHVRAAEELPLRRFRTRQLPGIRYRCRYYRNTMGGRRRGRRRPR